jgi:transporter family-2 protein
MMTGLIALAAGMSMHARSRVGLVMVTASVRDKSLPWWTILGGLFGGIFLVVQSATVPLVGVAVFTVGVVAGQTSGSLVVDWIGISASGKVRVTANRVVAAVLAVCAVFVAISDRIGTVGGTLAYASLAFLAGALIAPQQAANGRVGIKARSPFTAAFVNFAVGAVLLSAVLVIAMTAGSLEIHDAWGAPAWSYVGGLIGVMVVAGAAWVVPVLGVLVFSLLSVFGQLFGAFLLDAAFPTSGTSLGWHLLVGITMAFVAVLVAATSRWSKLSGGGTKRTPRDSPWRLG